MTARDKRKIAAANRGSAVSRNLSLVIFRCKAGIKGHDKTIAISSNGQPWTRKKSVTICNELLVFTPNITEKYRAAEVKSGERNITKENTMATAAYR